MAVQESKHDLGDSVSPVLVASWVRVALSCCCLQKALCMFEGQVLRPREDLKHGFPLFTQCEYMLISRPVSSLVEKKSPHSCLHTMEQQTNWVTFAFIYTDEEYFTACWFFASRPFMESFWAHSTLPSLTNLSSAHQTHASVALHKDLSVFPSEVSAPLPIPALWPRSRLSFP